MKILNRLVCFIFGHRWKVANEVISKIFFKECSRCSKEKYSHKMKSIMLSFFQFNIELSKFVQEAYFLKWNHLSEAEMRIVHQESSKIIQSEAQYDVDHIEFVRKKIMTINRKMLKKLMNIQKNISRNLYENA